MQMKKNQGVIAIKRVQAVLGSVMLRRKKDTIIDGKPILSLPARNIHVSSTDFVDPCVPHSGEECRVELTGYERAPPITGRSALSMTPFKRRQSYNSTNLSKQALL
jgi:hypothetical protein